MDISTSSTPPYESRRINTVNTNFHGINKAAIIKFFRRIQLITVLLFALCLHVNAGGFSPGTVHPEKKAPLKIVLSKIAQQIRGKVIDADTKDPLVGASVTLKGTANVVSTGLDGSFKISVDQVSGPVLVITYIGYITREVTLSGNTDLGEIGLKSSTNSMSEVVINGDVAIDRKTPIAVSNINLPYIEEHIGTQDIPELLNIVPGVYATQQGGGYGDSRISIRGFSSQGGQGNVAYTINGIPVNDPESGAIYWSDFSGILDAATSIQVQRGLGASKVIVPSFGGTVNVTSRSTDLQQGGYVSQVIGSDNYQKTSVLVSTGVNSNGWAATFQGSRTMGNGNADGLNFVGYNYFFNLSKILSPNQTLSFNVIGGNQNHGERYEGSIADYAQAPQGIRWNAQLGVKDGQLFNPSNNFWSEPLFSLNHDWTINDKSSLNTVAYAIYGDGGGRNIGGNTPPRISNFYSPYDFTAAEQMNAASPDGSALTYLYASHDNTEWYGLRSTYKTMIGKYTNLQAGIDLRYYDGLHYQVVTDLLGANYVLDTYGGNPAKGTSGGDINNPNHMAVVGDKISYDNEDYVESESVFAQAEYSKKNFTAFVTLTGADNGQKRADYFTYLNSDPEQKTPYVYYSSYQAKGGANYNISSAMNIYANIGYLTKPPYYETVFENFTNQINKHAVDEKLFSYELGYGYKTSAFGAKIDLYRTSYKDRTDQSSVFDPTTNQLYSANVTGVDELHQGIEVILQWRPVKEISIRGMLSVGDYHYTNNPGPTTVYNSQNQPVPNSTIPVVYLNNEKIGDVPQTTGSINMDLEVLPQLKFGVIWNYFTNYTSDLSFQNYAYANIHPYMVPAYSLFSLNGVLKFKMAGFDASLIGTVTNLLNTKYISDSTDNGYGTTASGNNAYGQAAGASVYYGLGRVITTGLKIKF